MVMYFRLARALWCHHVTICIRLPL